MKTLIAVMIAVFGVATAQASVATSLGISESDAAKLRGAFQYIIDNSDNATNEGKIIRGYKIKELKGMYIDAVKNANSVEKSLLNKYGVEEALQRAELLNQMNSAKSRVLLKKNAESFLGIIK